MSRVVRDPGGCPEGDCPEGANVMPSLHPPSYASTGAAPRNRLASAALQQDRQTDGRTNSQFGHLANKQGTSVNQISAATQDKQYYKSTRRIFRLTTFSMLA